MLKIMARQKISVGINAFFGDFQTPFVRFLSELSIWESLQRALIQGYEDPELTVQITY